MKTKKSKAEINAYSDGGMAYNDGKPATENPYTEDEALALQWLEGWTAAYDFDNSTPAD